LAALVAVAEFILLLEIDHLILLKNQLAWDNTKLLNYRISSRILLYSFLIWNLPILMRANAPLILKLTWPLTHKCTSLLLIKTLLSRQAST
jgi:hypothetical protein